MEVYYNYEVWYDGQCLTTCEQMFETEDEARAYAVEEINSRVDDWKYDGAWKDTDSMELFSIEIIYFNFVFPFL